VVSKNRVRADRNCRQERIGVELSMGFSFTIALGFQLAVSKAKGFTLKAPKIRIKDTPSRVKVTVLAKVK
jgi:hypothetical protein